jgi:hypothetical protein
MNGEVYYLSFFSELQGFLFPDELPINYYSPGLFLVIPEGNGVHAYSYTFDAMDNGRRISLSLLRADEENPQSTLYVVKTNNYGSFWFDLRKINPRFRYIGGRQQLYQHRDFSIAVSADADKLERVCKSFNFYFIASTLRARDL